MDRQKNMTSQSSPRRAPMGERCPHCRGEGLVPSPGEPIEYDPVHDELYGMQRCSRCEGSGEFPESARLYECPASTTCGVLVDGPSLRAMLEQDLRCRCGAPGRHFNLLPQEDEPAPDDRADALWTLEEISSCRRMI